MIRINNLQKNFGTKKAVDIENYTIGQGDMLGLVGNNGAGKTTLFRLILDLLQADRGNVTINDIDVSKSEDWKNFTGAFIDDGFLIDYLTPEEYFYFIGKMYGLKKEEVDERLLPFERFMNGEVMGQKKFIRNYSAGNKQKIGIISAMLHHPQLLILDEPFNFLDPSSQSVIKHLLKRYNEEHGATVIISSHNLNHTVDVCPRIALLENGVIIRDIRNENNSAEQELEAYFNVGVEEEAVVEETVEEEAVEKITEKEEKTGILISDFDFEQSSVYSIISEGKIVAEVCREYLSSPEIQAQAVVIYPAKDGVNDWLKGIVLQIINDDRKIHGGKACLLYTSPSPRD